MNIPPNTSYILQEFWNHCLFKTFGIKSWYKLIRNIWTNQMTVSALQSKKSQNILFFNYYCRIIIVYHTMLQWQTEKYAIN